MGDIIKMDKITKKLVCTLLLSVLLLVLLPACSNQESADSASSGENQEIPEIKISWGNDLHTAIPYVSIEKGEEFKESGVYLKPLSEDKFELIEDDKKLAVLSFIPTKGGSEIATLYAQDHLDVGLCSNTAILSAVDKGTKAKILCPVQTGGISMVVLPDKDISGWDEVKSYILSSKVPVKIGYHSPTSGPRIVIENVLKKEGIKVTEDPNDVDADVLLVDLKGDRNLLPSLSSNQVDAWVGPCAFPETAEHKGIGKIAMTLDQFPPEGDWGNFPCCVLSARQEIIDKHPEVIKALVHLIDKTCDYCMENRDEVAKILSGFIGIEEDIIKAATINYTTDPSDEWLEGIKVYVKALNDMSKFDENLKDNSFDEIKEKAFDFSFIQNLQK